MGIEFRDLGNIESFYQGFEESLDYDTFDDQDEPEPEINEEDEDETDTCL